MVDTTQPPITDDNVAYLVYIPAGVFFFICPVLVALRLLARLRRGGGLGADDWAAVLALVSSSAPRQKLRLSWHNNNRDLTCAVLHPPHFRIPCCRYDSPTSVVKR